MTLLSAPRLRLSTASIEEYCKCVMMDNISELGGADAGGTVEQNRLKLRVEVVRRVSEAAEAFRSRLEPKYCSAKIKKVRKKVSILNLRVYVQQPG